MSDSDNEKKKPSPHDIQKEFEDLIKNKYGEDIKFVTSLKELSKDDINTIKDEDDDGQKEKFELNFDLKPKDLKKHLDRFIIKQDEAKKALSIAVCDHYNHVKDSHETKDASLNYAKQNILLLGPTGVGKTYLIKLVANLVGVPFVKADATRFTEAGYVGASVEDLIKDLVSQAKGDIELAQYGIIYLDEADKLSTPHDVIGKDVGGRGVQSSLLKIMEETELDIRQGHDMASQIQSFMDFQKKGKVDKQLVNTKHILFIVSGAFTQLQDIIDRRLKKHNLGLGKKSLPERKGSTSTQNVLHEVSTKDLTDFGFESEFVGRLPIRVVCDELTEDDLYKILKDSEDSILKQYKRSFEHYGIKLSFSDAALKMISQKAHMEKTGARGLMTICEKILRDFKFELPDFGISELFVDASLVQDPALALKKILSETPTNDHSELKSLLRNYEKDYAIKYGYKIRFSGKATEEILKKIDYKATDLVSFCDKILLGYEYGLGLINKNSSEDVVLLDKDTVTCPTTALENLIKRNYHPGKIDGEGVSGALREQ